MLIEARLRLPHSSRYSLPLHRIELLLEAIRGDANTACEVAVIAVLRLATHQLIYRDLVTTEFTGDLELSRFLHVVNLSRLVRLNERR